MDKQSIIIIVFALDVVTLHLFDVMEVESNSFDTIEINIFDF